MSFKCSVFGHRYGDPEVEREREEQGSEVVITITETETCQRCGETRVVSENKEVTTLETPSDIVGDDIADPDDPAEPDASEAPTESSEPSQSVESARRPEADPPSPAPETADDAELIDEAEDSEPVAEDSEPGTADFESTGTAAGPTAWPGEEDTDDEDDAVILDESDGDGGDDREPGQWPDEAEDDDDEDDWTPGTGQELRPIEEEQPEVEPTADGVTVPDGEFYCPECEFTTEVESSSLRAGDFCPECHRGSLTHRASED